MGSDSYHPKMNHSWMFEGAFSPNSVAVCLFRHDVCKRWVINQFWNVETYSCWNKSSRIKNNHFTREYQKINIYEDVNVLETTSIKSIRPGIIQRWTLYNDFLKWPLVIYGKIIVTFDYRLNFENKRKLKREKSAWK